MALKGHCVRANTEPTQSETLVVVDTDMTGPMQQANRVISDQVLSERHSGKPAMMPCVHGRVLDISQPKRGHERLELHPIVGIKPRLCCPAQRLDKGWQGCQLRGAAQRGRSAHNLWRVNAATRVAAANHVAAANGDLAVRTPGPCPSSSLALCWDLSKRPSHTFAQRAPQSARREQGSSMSVGPP